MERVNGAIAYPRARGGRGKLSVRAVQKADLEDFSSAKIGRISLAEPRSARRGILWPGRDWLEPCGRKRGGAGCLLREARRARDNRIQIFGKSATELIHLAMAMLDVGGANDAFTELAFI